MGLHPSEILLGYERASKKMHEELEGQVCYTLKNIEDEAEVFKCMRASISSK